MSIDTIVNTINRDGSLSSQNKRTLRESFRDSDTGNAMATGPGTGITTGTGTVVKSSIEKNGDILKTTILVDLTGLNSSAAADIIGVDGGTANCHIGRVLAAESGTVFGGTMTCIEAPATGEPDIDLYSATEATGAEDTAITGLTETAILDAAADWTIGLQKSFGAIAANQYLYLVGSGAGTDATYTAGKFKIEFYGY